jgi:hypothetical protein
MCYPIDAYQWSFGAQYPAPVGAEVVVNSYEAGAYVHIFRLGFANLISLRTRLTSGYGFLVPHGSYMVVTKCSKDEHDNLCQLTPSPLHGIIQVK